jgi:hypothetical protein
MQTLTLQQQHSTYQLQQILDGDIRTDANINFIITMKKVKTVAIVKCG